MPIVSISEAAELTGKTRRTIQRHVASGKLSRSVANNGHAGVDISELTRVYGQLTSHDEDAAMSHPVISNVTHKNNKKDNERLLKLEHELLIIKTQLEAEKKRVQDKQETIDSLKTALKLLEYRQEKTQPKVNRPKKKHCQSLKKTVFLLIIISILDFLDALRSYFVSSYARVLDIFTIIVFF